MPAPVSIETPRKPTPASLPSVTPLPPNPPDTEFCKVLDRCGYLDARYAEAKHWIDERETVHKTIQEHYKDFAGNLPIHAEGADYTVDLGMRENQQKITDKAKAFASLRKAIGIKALIEALTYTLKLLDAHVPKEKQAAFIMRERTGPRTLRSAIKTAPKAA